MSVVTYTVLDEISKFKLGLKMTKEKKPVSVDSFSENKYISVSEGMEAMVDGFKKVQLEFMADFGKYALDRIKFLESYIETLEKENDTELKAKVKSLEEELKEENQKAILNLEYISELEGKVSHLNYEIEYLKHQLESADRNR